MQGDRDIHSGDISRLSAFNLNPRGRGIDRASVSAGGMLNRFAQKTGGGRATFGVDLFPSSLGYNFSAMNSCPRAKIDDVVGGSHGVLIVLDDDEGVSTVPQISKNA